MDNKLNPFLQVYRVGIHMNSGLLDSDGQILSGTLSLAGNGFLLSWTQASEDRNESSLQYSLTYLAKEKEILMERSGSGSLDLCFRAGEKTEGYLTIPQGIMAMKMHTIRMTIPEFAAGTDSSGRQTDYELLLDYRILFEGTDPTENVLSMKISLETEIKPI